MQIVIQHEWDLLDYEDPGEDRTAFVQNPKTYKRLNHVSSCEEYYPDPLWRIIALVVTFLVVSVLIVLTIAVAILCEVLKKGLESLLPIPDVVILVLGANLQVRCHPKAVLRSEKPWTAPHFACQSVRAQC